MRWDEGDNMDVEGRETYVGKDKKLDDLPQEVYRGERKEEENDDDVSQFKVRMCTLVHRPHQDEEDTPSSSKKEHLILKMHQKML